MQYELLEITNSAAKSYRVSVGTNWKNDSILRNLKLSRNFYCGEVVEDNENRTISKYGNLLIHKSNLDNKIYRVDNYNGHNRGCHIDNELKEYLNESYGITERENKIANCEYIDISKDTYLDLKVITGDNLLTYIEARKILNEEFEKREWMKQCSESSYIILTPKFEMIYGEECNIIYTIRRR